ncbi:MAG: hypothetical protein F8N37_20525 [Telmatospirillum sp.]|nr:hypothetical protein [Telmatospirillum sp.]
MTDGKKEDGATQSCAMPAAPEGEKRGLVARLTDNVKKSLSAVVQHCDAVEQAKAAGERENTLKLGKDWVNRCCG